jgi:bifunctional non-homologous end joining protein LigD
VTTLTTRLSFLEPMKPTLTESAPEGEDWLHELKYDGYRTQLILDRSDGRAFTRTGLDWSHQYRTILHALRELDCESAIIDGEVIVQRPNGHPDFHALRVELARKNPKGLVFIAFDLLHLDGRDLRREAVEDRRERLRGLLGENEGGRSVQFSDHVLGGGPEFFEAAERMGLEGIVSKKVGSRYRSGPSRSWLKTKSFTTSEFVVIGTSTGDLAPVALLARETEDHSLEYAGAAMVTFSEEQRERFWRANERLKTEKPALHMEPRPETGWLRPEMRVMVRHLRGEEMLRHATVRSISHLPQAPKPAFRKPRPAAERSKEPGHHVESGSVPERAALLAYYSAVAPLMLPFLSGRPLNLFRCHGRYCFFQRNRTHPETDQSFDEPIHKVPILQKNGRTEDYLYLDSPDGLIACVEADAVEFHGWGSRLPDYERPDRIALDLDPGEGVGFEQVRDAAFQIRASLEAIALESFPLLTGGKGIHVVVPFEADQEWPQVREFARGFCAALAEAAPEKFTISLPIAKRRGRIFLDYLRNQRTHTAIMPYSLRARPGTPVAAPVEWDELKDLDTPQRFTVDDVPLLRKRARRLDGWGLAKQRLPRLKS